MSTDKDKVTRKLSAILSADVKGYSLLMADDEAYTIKMLEAYRDSMSDLIRSHSGRVVDAVGDNLLAEFSSVVDAVRCAVEIQKDLQEKNTDLPTDKRLEFRIGVNIGDVVQEGDRIYGNGVNVAARIEALAESGGICISRNAYNHVRDKLDLGYEYLGEHDVKNIKRPVRAYKVLIDPEDAGKLIGEKPQRFRKKWPGLAVATVAILIGIIVWQFYYEQSPPIEAASVENMAFPLPDKPSIAVLPFKNLSGDPKQNYFSDGLTDQIINTLSKFRNLFVIARDSTYRYKGQSVAIHRIAEDLGVKYVLEGSVQRTAERIRITTQLIDATTGHQVWSERYDREQKDIFEIQDDITMELTNSIGYQITEGEHVRIYQNIRTSNLGAYEKFLQGRYYGYKATKKDNAQAHLYFKEALVLDPNYAAPYLGLGFIHFADARHGWVESPQESIKMAYEFAQKAINLDDNLEGARLLLGSIYIVKRQHDKAIEIIEPAVANNPNSALFNAYLGGWLGLAGRWQESIRYTEMSIRLSPYPPYWYFWVLGRAYYMTGQYEKAIEPFKKCVSVNPDFLIAHAFLAACYSSLGRQAEAATEADEVRRINPKFNLESYAKTLPYKNKADIDRYVAALRNAGLPYSRPLPLPDKPSIAVLAFDNMSGDPEQEYFSDGISENIITALSKVGELFVIARNSSFTYKGKPVKIQQVGRELGVRYVLEGSVQKSGDRVRITAQLIDATTGHHLWSERYDSELKDIFVLQDEITMKIVTSLRVKLTEGEHARIFYESYRNPDVYYKHIQAYDYWRKGNRESLERYGQLAKEIVELAPESQIGYRLLGWYHKALIDYRVSPKENFKKAFAFAQKSLSIDNNDPLSHSLMCSLYLWMREFEKSIASGKRSVELQPNGHQAHLLLGKTLCYAERFDEAIFHSKKAIRLNPFPAYYDYYNLGRCYYMKGQYDEALVELKKALQRAPDNAVTNLFIAVIHSILNNEEEARLSAKKALEISPNISMSYVSKTWRFKSKDGLKVTLDAMRRAGFPE